MDATSVVWTVGFPLLLFFVAVGVGVAFAMTSSDSIGFWVAKASFAAAAFDVIAFGIYWAVAAKPQPPWHVVFPTILAVVVIPVLVLSLQWLGGLEVKLSTRLFPGNESTPNPFDARVEIPNDALRVIVGSNIAWGTNMPYTILEIAGEKLIEVDRDSKNQLFVSILKIFDDRNNIIARVDAEDGLWVENSTRSKRPDKSTLVVYDHTDKEVLRLRLLNAQALSITGIFRHERLSRPVIITPDYMDLAGYKFSKSVMRGGSAVVSIGANR